VSLGLKNARESGSSKLFEDEGDWRTLGEDEEIYFARAFDSEVRRAILKFLSIGPMSPIELARLSSETFDKKCSDSLIYYHLELLEEAGLIGYTDNESGARVPYQKVYHRVQYAPRAESNRREQPGRSRTADQLEGELNGRGKR